MKFKGYVVKNQVDEYCCQWDNQCIGDYCIGQWKGVEQFCFVEYQSGFVIILDGGDVVDYYIVFFVIMYYVEQYFNI